MKKKHSGTIKGMLIERDEGKGRRKEWHPRGNSIPAGKWHKSKKDYNRKGAFNCDLDGAFNCDLDDPCPSDDEELGGDNFLEE